MKKTIKPSTRVESCSSSETGVAGEEHWSAEGGHKAQEKTKNITEPVDVVSAQEMKHKGCCGENKVEKQQRCD